MILPIRKGLILLIYLLTCQCFALNQTVSPACTADTSIDIPDIWLERAIKGTLSLNAGDGTPPITCGDIDSLTELYVSGVDYRISSLQGLEFASNLEVLVLPKLVPRYEVGHFVSSLEPLANLKELRKLEVYLGDISDLSPLSGLQELEYLKLVGHPLENLEPLANLQNLHTLLLPHNQIVDISALRQLRNLTNIDLSNNNISDISGFGNLKQLQILDLSRNNIIDVSSLSGLQRLQILDLSLNNVINPDLSNLPSLSELSIYFGGVTDLSFINELELTQPITVSLYMNFVHSLKPLLTNPQLPEGTIFELSGNCLDLREGSVDSLHVTELNQRGIRVKGEISNMDSGCIALKDLIPFGSDVLRLEDHHLLRALAKQTGYYKITDMAVAELTHLNLDLDHCSTLPISIYQDKVTCVQNLSGILYAKNLRYLVLNVTSTKDLSLLSQLPNLQTLILEASVYSVFAGKSLSDPVVPSLCLQIQDSNLGNFDLTPLLDNPFLWRPDDESLEVDEESQIRTQRLISELELSGIKVSLVDDAAQCLGLN